MTNEERLRRLRELAPAITEFCDLCHESSKAGGWWDMPQYLVGTVTEDQWRDIVIPTKVALIHSETSEMLEGFRTGALDKHLTTELNSEVEAADALIRLGDLAGAVGFDLGKIVVDKMAYNYRRADHKPENRQGLPGQKKF